MELPGQGMDTLSFDGVGAALAFILGGSSSITDGTNTVSYPGMAVENLVGGLGNDVFLFSDGATVAGGAGTIDGGGGNNTLNYAAYTTPVTVNLGTGKATGTSGIANIQTLVGGSAADTLVGTAAPNIWKIAAKDTGMLNGTFSFSSIENLTGGSGADTFAFADGAGVSGIVDGGDGVDRLNYSAYTTAVVVDFAGGTATGTGGTRNIEAVLGGSAPLSTPVANSVDGRPVTLGFADATLTSFTTVTPPAAPPIGVSFPVGFFGIKLTGVTSTAVTLTLPPGVTVDTYYKFGKTPADHADHFYKFLFDGTTGATFGTNAATGQQVITLHLVDGQRGDNDLTVNGTIVDPGAPGLRAAGGFVERTRESLYRTDSNGSPATPTMEQAA